VATAGDTGALLDANERAEFERVRREDVNYVRSMSFWKRAAALVVSEHNR
jgi:transposase